MKIKLIFNKLKTKKQHFASAVELILLNCETDFTHYLQDNKININYQDKDGETLLFWTGKADKHFSTVLCQNYSADTDITNNQGQTALMSIIEKENKDGLNINNIKNIIEYIKDWNIKDLKGKNYLHYLDKNSKKLPYNLKFIIIEKILHSNPLLIENYKEEKQNTKLNNLFEDVIQAQFGFEKQKLFNEDLEQFIKEHSKNSCWIDFNLFSQPEMFFEQKFSKSLAYKNEYKNTIEKIRENAIHTKDLFFVRKKIISKNKPTTKKVHIYLNNFLKNMSNELIKQDIIDYFDENSEIKNNIEKIDVTIDNKKKKILF